MRFLRAVSGALLWVLAAVVGLVAVVLCVTVILLPLGVPLLALARRLFGRAVTLMLPRTVTHPVDELGKATRKKGGKAAASTRKSSGKAAKSVRRGVRKAGRTADEVRGA
jgi:hypothetical protein